MWKSSLSKGIALFILLFLLVVTYVRAEEPTAAPVAKFPETRFDAGKVQEGAILRHDFAITNEGNAALTIQDLVPA